MLLRTRQRIKHRVKEFIFDNAGFQEMLELRNKYRLEDAMGFRGQFDEHRRFQIAFLKKQGLVPSSRFLEIGCGPLTAGIPVIEYLETGNYIGIDVRNSVLDLAWKEVGKAGLSMKNPRLICSSSFGSMELGGQTFDFILSFSVLYHLTDEILKNYFETVRKRLAPKGVCFANVNTLHENSTWLEFPFLKRTIEVYKNLAAESGLTVDCLGELNKLGFHLSGAESRNELLSFRIR
jgi:cyclopropane fatty-acyl-phospholipid synthase-like methyltransferase